MIFYFTTLTPPLSPSTVLRTDLAGLTTRQFENQGKSGAVFPLSPGGRELERGGEYPFFHTLPGPLPSRERGTSSDAFLQKCRVINPGKAKEKIFSSLKRRLGGEVIKRLCHE